MKYVLRLSIGLAFTAALAAGVVYAKTERDTLRNIGFPGAKTPGPSALSAEPGAPGAPEQPAAPGAPAPAGAPVAPASSPHAVPQRSDPLPPARTPAARVPARRPQPAPRKPTRVPPRKPAPVQPRPPAPVPPIAGAATLKAQVTDLVNAERGTAGCAPVQVDARLAAAAQKHSDDMAQLNYFAHDSKDGRSAFDRIRAEGYSQGRAENIAKGQQDADAVMRAWNGSAGHHRNIVDCDIKAIGVGVARGSDGALVWTQDFGAA